MYDLTGFQRDLLYVIAGLDEPHGLAIKEGLEEYYDSPLHGFEISAESQTILLVQSNRCGW
jgi:hypothetical protein